jgi:hypothetical protein
MAAPHRTYPLAYSISATFLDLNATARNANDRRDGYNPPPPPPSPSAFSPLYYTLLNLANPCVDLRHCSNLFHLRTWHRREEEFKRVLMARRLLSQSVLGGVFGRWIAFTEQCYVRPTPQHRRTAMLQSDGYFAG